VPWQQDDAMTPTPDSPQHYPPDYFAAQIRKSDAKIAWQYGRIFALAGLPDLRGRRVLDVGCGAGPGLRYLLARGAQAVVAHGIAQRQQGIDVRLRPMHPRPFEAVFDHQFVGTFDHPTANRPTRRLKRRIGHLIDPLFQILQRRLHRLVLCGLIARPSPQARQDGLRPLVLQVVAHLRDGRRVLARADANRLHIARRVREVQDAHRFGIVQVDEGLNPLRPVGHDAHPARAFDPTLMQFQCRQGTETRTVGAP
jgi:SAM-dependent methyltransferase